MGRKDHVCPVCGQPVDTVAGRRKTLGAWVPVWKPGPCRNPGCAVYGESAEPSAAVTGEAPAEGQEQEPEAGAKQP